MEAPTTGLQPVDELIGGLRVGDNVVIRAAQAEDAVPLLSAALRSAYGTHRLVYVTFSLAPKVLLERYGDAWDPERFVLLDYRDSADTVEDDPAGMRVQRPAEPVEPAAVGRELRRIGQEWGRGTRYIIDGLTDVSQRWGDRGVLELFLTTCPALYREGTIAYWTLQPDKHSPSSLEQLTEVTQVVLDLSTEGTELILELAKAAGRPPHLRGGRVHAAVDGERVEVLRRVEGTRARAGELIRKRRAAMGLSQTELARRVGISPSALSQAERGRHGLSGEVLTRVWEAMEVPFGPTAASVQSPLQVFRRGQPPTAAGTGLTVETIADRTDLGAHILDFAAGANGAGGPFRTKHRELVLVLEGVLQLRVGQYTETLQPGDAALITDEPVAAWANPGVDAARAVWLLLP